MAARAAHGIDVQADVRVERGSDEARILSTPTGIRVETESPGAAWRLYRTLRGVRRGMELVLTRVEIPLEVAIGGRVVARKAPSSRRVSLHALSFFKALFGVKVATPSRGVPTIATRFPMNGAMHKEHTMSNERKDTQTWPELAGGLYEQLTGRGAEISYQFDDLEVAVPSRVGEGADFAKWRLNGALRIRTEDRK